MPRKGAKKRYNLRDVAEHANVSVATVSRVLNAPTRVMPATRERVEAAMTQLRFVPSAAARAINSGRTRMVAALLPTLDNAIYARVVDGLESRLSSFGLSLMVAQTAGDPDLEHARAKQLIDIGAEGLVVVGITHSPAFHALIEHTGIPVLAVSYFDPSSSVPTIGYDNWAAAILAANHLLDLGHTNISVVHPPLSNNDRAQQRNRAVKSLPGSGAFSFLETDLSFSGGCIAAQKIAADSTRPTAVLCFSDVIAMGVITEFQKRCIAVPQEISVLGMEDLPSSAAFNPPITSVQLQVQKMGELAAEGIASWVEDGNVPASACLPSELIVRASTAARENRK